MTHDEMIEAVARAICEADKPAFEKRERWPIIGTVLQAQFKGIARAAIRVIAPAVLEEAAYCAAATNANCYGDPTDVYETMIDAIRAMKTRYEQ